MYQREVVNIVKRIFKEDVDNNVCIFIDGDWGVGKTYSVNSLSEESNEELIIKYVSVFGKSQLEQIEKDLIMQLMTATNKVNKIMDNNAFKLFGNVLTEALKIGGIELNFGDLLNNLKIENVSSNKFKGRIVLCIDDLERKSPDITIKDLLGLIERASTNFSVVFIANSTKLGDDTETFNEYKEKLIDYQFVIDQIDLETLENIAQRVSNGLNMGIQKSISQIYYNILIDDQKQESRFKNIRIFKKCIELLNRINDVVRTEFPNDEFKIDKEIILLCMKVIHDHFIPISDDSTKNWIATNHKKMMYETFRSIFLYERYDSKVLEDYLIQNSEISKDIRKLYSGYQMNEVELRDLLKKINHNIDEENKTYFKEPNIVVSLFDALDSIGELSDITRDKLLKLALSLYAPTVENGHLFLNNEDWYDYDYMGNETENRKTTEFINLINSCSNQKYEEFIKQEYNKAIGENNISKLYGLIQTKPVTDTLIFEKVFDLAFEAMTHYFDDELWRFIHSLIMNVQTYDFTRKLIQNRLEKIPEKSIQLKYKQLLNDLDEMEYHEYLNSDEEHEEID